MTTLIAPALRPGDTVALVAPAGPCDPMKTQRAIHWLESEGFTVKTYADLYRVHGYLAGDDKTRIEEMNAALADPEVAAIFPVRGGYGTMRILPHLDLEQLLKQPKIIAGFSDITALHLAIQKRTGLVTFHSPHPQDGYGAADGLSALAERTYRRALWADSYQFAEQSGYTVPLNDNELTEVSCLIEGTARGRLIGGNLALVCAMLGTADGIETEGSILLLEDVDEPPYRIDRFLAQLQLSGKLQNASGIILGQFTNCQENGDSPSLSLEEIFAGYFAELSVPVICNYPVGHIPNNATLPLGAEVEITAETGTVRILEDPVRGA